MKGCLIVAAFSLISLATCIPVQNGMIFYRQPGYYNTHQRNQAYHQAMLLQYAQQPFARSAGAGMSAFASGDTIAAGTYLQDSKVHQEHVSGTEQQEVAYDNSDDVHAIAEAYPQDPSVYTDESVQRQQEQANEIVPPNVVPLAQEQPAILNQQAPEAFAPPQPIDDQTAVADLIPTTQAAVPAVPKKKKVHVELEDADDDDDDDDEDFVPFATKPKKQNRNSPQYPPYTFFPLSFGSTSGGAIAVANAFSTGRGGARSHAIAYGSPPSSRQKAAKRHADDE